MVDLLSEFKQEKSGGILNIPPHSLVINQKILLQIERFIVIGSATNIYFSFSTSINHQTKYIKKIKYKIE